MFSIKNAIILFGLVAAHLSPVFAFQTQSSLIPSLRRRALAALRSEQTALQQARLHRRRFEMIQTTIRRRSPGHQENVNHHTTKAAEAKALAEKAEAEGHHAAHAHYSDIQKHHEGQLDQLKVINDKVPHGKAHKEETAKYQKKEEEHHDKMSKHHDTFKTTPGQAYNPQYVQGSGPQSIAHYYHAGAFKDAREHNEKHAADGTKNTKEVDRSTLPATNF